MQWRRTARDSTAMAAGTERRLAEVSRVVPDHRAAACRTRRGSVAWVSRRPTAGMDGDDVGDCVRGASTRIAARPHPVVYVELPWNATTAGGRSREPEDRPLLLCRCGFRQA